MIFKITMLLISLKNILIYVINVYIFYFYFLLTRKLKSHISRERIKVTHLSREKD